MTLNFSPLHRVVGDNNCECLCLSCEQAGIRGFVSTNFPGYRSVSPHSTEATNIQNSPEVASTSHFSSMTRDVSPAHLRPRGPRGRSSRRNNHQAVSVSVFPVTSNLISKCGSTSGLDDPCVTCHTHSVSIPDTRLCTRFVTSCLRGEFITEQWFRCES